MVRLSLTMIVKNESQKLGRCLESVRHLVDEIVVVDTGSTDNTKEIARAYGANVYDYAWNDSFADARNFAFEQSSGDWNLVLDADEYILNDCAAELRAFIASSKKIGRIKLFDKFEVNGEIREARSYLSRLFPKGLRYEGKIHEQIVGDYPREDTTVEIYHDGYFRTNKSNRNVTMLRDALAQAPEDAYLLFQLGREYRMSGDYAEAVRCLSQSYAIARASDPFRPAMIVDYLYAIVANKNLATGIPIIAAESARLSDSPDFHFACGIFYMELVLSDTAAYIAYFPNIEQSYLTCLKLGESARVDCVKGSGSFRAAYNLGTYYESVGDLDQAKLYYARSAQEHYPLAIQRLAEL